MSLVDIPYQSLSSQVVRKIIEDFVLEEGTDYGVYQFNLEEKVGHVMRQLEAGRAKIVYDAKREKAYIVKN